MEVSFAEEMVVLVVVITETKNPAGDAAVMIDRTSVIANKAVDLMIVIGVQLTVIGGQLTNLAMMTEKIDQNRRKPVSAECSVMARNCFLKIFILISDDDSWTSVRRN